MLSKALSVAAVVACWAGAGQGATYSFAMNVQGTAVSGSFEDQRLEPELRGRRDDDRGRPRHLFAGVQRRVGHVHRDAGEPDPPPELRHDLFERPRHGRVLGLQPRLG